jgi:hypothetical protein
MDSGEVEIEQNRSRQAMQVADSRQPLIGNNTSKTPLNFQAFGK